MKKKEKRTPKSESRKKKKGEPQSSQRNSPNCRPQESYLERLNSINTHLLKAHREDQSQESVKKCEQSEQAQEGDSSGLGSGSLSLLRMLLSCVRPRPLRKAVVKEQ